MREENVWVTSPERLAAFLGENDGAKRSRYTERAEKGLDMTTAGWIFVGTSVTVYAFTQTEEMYAKALAACDEQEAALRRTFEARLASLRDFRQTLLALPAPPAAPPSRVYDNEEQI